MTNIQYTTVDKQIDKLLSQKLIIKDIDSAKDVLTLFGYSNLIKSYREPYVIKTESSIEYRTGVVFEQISSFFICLDYRNTAAHGGRIYNHNCHHKLRNKMIFDDKKHLTNSGFSQFLFLLSLFEYKVPYKYLQASLEQELTRHCSHFPEDITYLEEIFNINIISKHVVFITNSSNKYHTSPYCSGIKNPSEIELDEAKKNGYIPCKRCNNKH